MIKKQITSHDFHFEIATGCSELYVETAGKSSRHGGAREKKTQICAAGTSYNLHQFVAS